MAESFSQHREISTSDTAKIVGCWNALAKRSLGKLNWGDAMPVKRAVAFLGTIKKSKHLKEYFNTVVSEFKKNNPNVKNVLNCSVHHVDGTQNALKRNKELRWLKDNPEENECRILSNARCLSEGIDVPALDAVMFLNPRRSEIDIVQSVGRVMRKSPGKSYGYIILPVIIPRDIPPSKALDDNNAYAAVWEVLQALRSHDNRFDTMINQIKLNKKHPSQILFPVIDDKPEYNEGEGNEANEKPDIGELPLHKLREAILAKLVIKCGDRTYYKKWAEDIAETVRINTNRINALKIKNGSTRIVFNSFLKGLRENLNQQVTEKDAVDMLAQHMVTKPIFEALFEKNEFSKKNIISRSMEEIIKKIENQTSAETKDLKEFYDSIRKKVAGIDNAEGRQTIIKELYEDFFKKAFPKMTERLGIIYTPVEVVDFILQSVDLISKKEFGNGLTSKNVNILDPFLGTGTFITRLLQSDIIDDKDLERKYQFEISCK